MTDKLNGTNLSDVLSLGTMDLMDVLVRSGISCRTCYKNPDFKSWDQGGIMCGDKFVSAPELSVCMKWREGRTTDQIKACSEKGYSALEATE